MNKKLFSGTGLWIVHIILFILISVVYFMPDIMEGKQLYQNDVTQYKGASKEILDYRNEYHKEPLWTNSMFGGMPAYLIDTKYKDDLFKYIGISSGNIR